PDTRRFAGARARGRREQPHEAGEVVDAPAAGAGVSDIFRLGNRIADAHPLGRDAIGGLAREDVVRDAHLVAVGVATERQQGRVLRLPTEAADARLAAGGILDASRAARDTVTVAIERVLQQN